MAKQSLQEQVEHILMAAEKRGVTNNFFFVTTFKRYQVQMQILTSLEKAIADNGPTVTKEYVKEHGVPYDNDVFYQDDYHIGALYDRLPDVLY